MLANQTADVNPSESANTAGQEVVCQGDDEAYIREGGSGRGMLAEYRSLSRGAVGGSEDKEFHPTMRRRTGVEFGSRSPNRPGDSA